MAGGRIIKAIYINIAGCLRIAINLGQTLNGRSINGTALISIFKHASNWYGYRLSCDSSNLSSNAIMGVDPPSLGFGLAPYLQMHIFQYYLCSENMIVQSRNTSQFTQLGALNFTIHEFLNYRILKLVFPKLETWNLNFETSSLINKSQENQTEWKELKKS